MASQTITALCNAIINLVDRKTPIATANTVGMVKPDGSTINIDANGVISSNGGGGSSLEICDIGMSLYVDETKGLRRYLNGQIVDINTNTQAFLNRLLQIQATNPDYFTTEENWQTEALLNIDGCVYKFVLNYGEEKQTVTYPVFSYYDSITEDTVYYLVKKNINEIQVGDLAYFFNKTTNTPAETTTVTVASIESPSYSSVDKSITLSTGSTVYNHYSNGENDYVTTETVITDNVVSVRLPKYPDYVEVSAGSSITTAPVTGFVKSTTTSGIVCLPRATLNPNWDGSYALTSNGKYGHFDMFAQDGSGNVSVRNTGSTSVYYVDAQADLSNLKLKNTKLKLYYFIQIATGSETENNIINEIELNNPYSLFDFKWTDHEQNNLSWTRGDTFDWKPSATYPSAYNELLSEYNNSESVEETESGITFKRTPKGYKIALADQETAIQSRYETYGIAWYYILDTTNTQFKLPRTKFGFEGLRGNVGDDIAESLPNIKGMFDRPNAFGVGPVNGAFFLGDNVGGYSRATNSTDSSYVNFDASRSSSTYQDNAPVQERATQMYLYFYVGETVQNANLIDAGRIGEQLANKVDLDLTNANPSQAFKNKSVSWGIPDYSAGIAVAVGVDFKAPVCGVIAGEFTAAHSGFCYLYINGVLVEQMGAETNQRCRSTFYARVGRNDTVKVGANSAGGINLAKFYPLKGAN